MKGAMTMRAAMARHTRAARPARREGSLALARESTSEDRDQDPGRDELPVEAFEEELERCDGGERDRREAQEAALVGRRENPPERCRGDGDKLAQSRGRTRGAPAGRGAFSSQIAAIHGSSIIILHEAADFALQLGMQGEAGVGVGGEVGGAVGRGFLEDMVHAVDDFELRPRRLVEQLRVRERSPGCRSCPG